MNSQKLPIDDTGHRNQIERVHYYIINLLVIFIFAFVSKIEETCHLAAFMVSPQKINCGWVVYLNRVQEDKDFD